jgi:SOS-response transcriptional repressor LexA/DNA-binding XRE family transcriptional regulator
MTQKIPIAGRLKALAEVAGSQAKLAAAAGISEGTIINWSRGLGLRDSKLEAAAANLGIAMAWLRDGEGDTAEQLEAFRERLQAAATVREEAPHEPRAALKFYRQRAGLSYAQLARLTRRPPAFLEQLEVGTAPLSEAAMELICEHVPGLTPVVAVSDHPEILSVTGAEATYGARPKLVLPPGMTGRYVPLLSLAEAGPFDANHSDAIYDYTAVFAPNVDDRRAFAIKVSGNSMEPDINDGDLVICSPTSTVQNGEAAVVRTRSEQVFVKYWRQRGERVELESANPDYDPIALPRTEILGAWPVVQRIASGKIQRKL